MAEPSGGRIQMTILGGYLGSGKTTWLRHQLHAGQFANGLVIVNEAAETPVDDALLQQSARLEVLPGGCCCCEGLAALLNLLRGICDERSRVSSGEARLQRIILETSGLADPAPIVEAIRSDKMLVYHIAVHEVIVVVDALNAASQLSSEPLGRRQLEIADRLIISKLDSSSEADNARLVATLRQINPGAAISGSVRGSDWPLPADNGAQPYELPPLSGDIAKPPPFPARIRLGGDIDWTTFSVWLSALLHARGDDVLRVKGVVRTEAGRLLVQAVRRIVQAPEILPPLDEGTQREDNTIVIIGRGYEGEDLTRSLRTFAGLPPQ